MTELSSNIIRQLTEAMAPNRETTDRQLNTLAATVEKTSHNLDRAVSRMEESGSRLEQSASRIEQQIDRALIGMQQSADRIEQQVERGLVGMEQSANRIEQQVGVMSEHLMAIDIKIERLTDRIDRLSAVVERLAQSIDGHLEIAKQQSINISELTRLVATQANTVAILINRNYPVGTIRKN